MIELNPEQVNFRAINNADQSCCRYARDLQGISSACVPAPVPYNAGTMGISHDHRENQTTSTSALQRSNLLRPEYAQFLNDHIATNFDAVRPFSKALVQILVDRCHLDSTKAALDVGCGKGLYTIPIQILSGATVVGLDPSVRMMDVARAVDKGGRVEWVQEGIASYERAHYYDALIATNVMHQLIESNEGDMAIASFHRLLKPNGSLAIAYCARSDMERQPHALLFPGVLDTAAKRAEPVEKLKDVLPHYGFHNIRIETVNQPVRTDVEFLLGIGRDRGTSTLQMMYQASPPDYQKKLEEFESAVRDRYGIVGAVEYDYSLTLLTAQRGSVG